MTQRKHDPKPGSNQGEAPSTSRDTPDGKILIFFKGPGKKPPEEYDYSVSHHTRKGWRVYFLLVCAALVPVCLLVRLIVGIGGL